MTDDQDEPVSMSKRAPEPADESGAAPAAESAGTPRSAARKPARATRTRSVPVPTPEGVERPATVLVVVAGLALSGLAAILGGLLLFGHKSELIHDFTKTNPPINSASSSTGTAPTASAIADSVGEAVTANLKPGVVSAGTVSTVADKAADVLADHKVLPTKNISASDLSSQQTKVRDLVKDKLKAGQDVTDVASVASAVQSGTETNLTTLGHAQVSDIVKQAGSLPKTYTILGLVVSVAMGLAAGGVYRGRYWGRWVVAILWAMFTLFGALPGLSSLQTLRLDLPKGFGAAATLSGAAMLLAVVASFLKPTRRWFAAHKPALPEGMSARRGLFAPRVPPAPRGGAAAPSTGRSGGAGRAGGAAVSRAKQRSETDTSTPTEAGAGRAPRGGPGQRPRKTSKSRRTEV